MHYRWTVARTALCPRVASIARIVHLNWEGKQIVVINLTPIGEILHTTPLKLEKGFWMYFCLNSPHLCLTETCCMSRYLYSGIVELHFLYQLSYYSYKSLQNVYCLVLPYLTFQTEWFPIKLQFKSIPDHIKQLAASAGLAWPPSSLLPGEGTSNSFTTSLVHPL